MAKPLFFSDISGFGSPYRGALHAAAMPRLSSLDITIYAWRGDATEKPELCCFARGIRLAFCIRLQHGPRRSKLKTINRLPLRDNRLFRATMDAPHGMRSISRHCQRQT